MGRKSTQRAVLEERARHLQKVESPRLRWHRECVGKEMKGRKFRDREEVTKALTQAARSCAARNPFTPKKKS